MSRSSIITTRYRGFFDTERIGVEAGPLGDYTLQRMLDFAALSRFSPTCTAMVWLSYGK